MMLARIGAVVSLLIGVSVVQADSRFGVAASTWSHIGANTPNFDREGGVRRLEMFQQTGARWDRCDFWWGRIEPEQGKFSFRDYDWVIEQYRQRKIELMPILCYASAWSGGNAPVTDEERQRYARFVFEMVSRYKPHVHTWEIWNEPNITPYWSPTPNAKDYTALLKLAYQAAKKANPNCTIVGAATAGTDIAFIEEMLQHGAGDYMDVVSIHPYQGDLGSLSPDKGGLASHIRGVQTMLAEYGYRKPIFITEMGHRTTGTRGHTEVTEEQQAAYLVRSYVIAFHAGVERLFWFNMHDWEERWGLIRQNFEPKPSFRAYQVMVQQLSGKPCVGTIELQENLRGYVFAPAKVRPTATNSVMVLWNPDDTAMNVPVPGRRILAVDGSPIQPRNRMIEVGMNPVYIAQIDAGMFARLQPVPELPPLGRKFVEPVAPALPATPGPWLEGAKERFAVALSFREAPDRPTPIRITDAPASAEVFTVADASARLIGHAQRDLDGKVIFLAPPSREKTATFYFYPSSTSETTLRASADAISNGRLTIRFNPGKYAREIELHDVYISRADELGGIFTASYEDTDKGWPRIDGSAKVLEQTHHAGPVLTQYRSKIAFGLNDVTYQFTFTLYAGSNQVSYEGRWLSPGTGGAKLVNLGDTFPEGTVVTGVYGQATLPAAGAHYGRAAVIRPADHSSVTAVMVSPNGYLTTPGWAKRSVVGTGHFYNTVFPSTVSAEYFWYVQPPDEPLEGVARRHHLAVAFPPLVVVGKMEQRP